MDPEALRTARYKALLDAMGVAMAHRYGWKSIAARALGIVPSHAAKVLAGEVTTISADIAQRVVERGVPRSYFDAGDGDPTALALLLLRNEGETQAVEPAVARDPEAAAIDAVASLDPEARRRVIVYLTGRFL